MKKFQNIIGLASILLMSVALTLTSCGGGGGGDDTPKSTLKSINVQGASNTLNVGETIQLSATANPTTATLSSLAWKSTKTNVATVNNNGVVTAVSAGSTTIQATSQGKTGSYQITVSAAPTEINAESISLADAISLSAGQTQQLQATVSPANATYNTVTWSTSDANIVTVNDGGLIEAKATGSAVITATVTNGDNTKVEKSCTVTVVNDNSISDTGEVGEVGTK